MTEGSGFLSVRLLGFSQKEIKYRCFWYGIFSFLLLTANKAKNKTINFTVSILYLDSRKYAMYRIWPCFQLNHCRDHVKWKKYLQDSVTECFKAEPVTLYRRIVCLPISWMDVAMELAHLHFGLLLFLSPLEFCLLQMWEAFSSDCWIHNHDHIFFAYSDYSFQCIPSFYYHCVPILAVAAVILFCLQNDF